jgi:hypothetical protein
MAAYLPPGWPAGVHPPGSEGFTESAVAWLLEVIPPDYRLHGVLHRHPAALAALARHHTTACVEGARQGYRTVRTELAETVPPPALDSVLAVYRTEGQRLAAAAKAVDLVERALHGERFTLKLLFFRTDSGGSSAPTTVAGPSQPRPLPVAAPVAAWIMALVPTLAAASSPPAGKWADGPGAPGLTGCCPGSAVRAST